MLAVYGVLVISLLILFVLFVSGWLTFEVTFFFFIKANESFFAGDALVSLSGLFIV